MIEVLDYASGCHTDSPVTVSIMLNVRNITTITPLYSFGHPTFYEISFGGNERVHVSEEDRDRVVAAVNGL